MKRKDKCKAKTTGSIMVSAILAIFVWIGIAQSMAIIANSGFKSIKSGRTAIQAQQYADISIDRLKNINYDELDTAGAHTRAVISGLSTTDWEDEVTIGAESTIAGSDDVKQRIATVNVYKTGDTLPRYTVEVPLSSQSSNSNKGTDEGYNIKGGIIPAGGANYKTIFFDKPFNNNCIGVVVTQSRAAHGSLTNIAVPSFNANSFIIYAEAEETAAPIYYLAFGY